MQIINTLLSIFTPQGFEGLIQFLSVIVMIVYVLFAFMLTRLVKIMNRSFKSPYTIVFQTVASLHFLAAVGIVLLAILLL
jgi:hypothetical protein